MYSWLERGGLVVVFAIGIIFGFSLFILFTGNVKAESFSFIDLPEVGWYLPAVAHMNSIQVIRGYPDGSFRPDHSINRAEMVTILSRYHEYLLQHYFSQHTKPDEFFLRSLASASDQHSGSSVSGSVTSASVPDAGACSF